MGAYKEIPYHDLGIAGVFVLVGLAVSRLEKLDLDKALILGALRAFAQLMAVGYVLKYVFELDQWYHVLLMLTLMVLVAARSSSQRVERPPPGLQYLMVGTIYAAMAAVMAPVAIVILRLDVWYQPQYIIPISGMMIGNAMNGAAVAVDRLMGEVRLRRPEIETKLSPGATWQQAAQASRRNALRAGLIPTINTITVYGLVQLPGMMTGQIIGGVEPVEAVKYQILIAYMLVGAVGISAFLTVRFACRRLFTKDHQLAPWLLEEDSG